MDGKDELELLRYRNIFEHTPVALTENDFTAVFERIKELKAAGVTDFDAYVDEHPETLWELTPHITIVDCNLQALQFMGAQDKSQVVGYTLKQMIHDETSFKAFRDQFVAAARGEHYFESESAAGMRPDGSLIHLLFSWTALDETPDGQRHGLGAMIDITRRVVAEQALAAANQELKRSNEDLERFAYVISHDLQEPLRALTGFSQLLARSYGDKLDDRGKRFLDQVVSGAERMRVLINGLLELSRLSTEPPALAPVDCGPILEQVLASIEVLRQETGAQITHDPMPTVMGNAIRLTQLFLNLITNALKFRRAEQPRVHIGAEREGREWHLRVEDNGIGIERKDLEVIFEMFKRLHGRGEYPGAGIGLAVVKRIIELHGGRIRVESEPGQGSVFHFTLTAAEVPA
jgi:PAS domain S-box-containing protein